MAKERTSRRTREWGMRAKKIQRLGHRREREAREQRELDEQDRERKEHKAATHKTMIENALSVDKKWREEAKVRED